MLSPIITYFNQQLQALNIFQELPGLCEFVTESFKVEGQDIEARFPALYKGNDNLSHITRVDFRQGVAFFLQNGNVIETVLDPVRARERYIQRSIPVRVVAIIGRKVYNTDNEYTSQEISSDVLRSVSRKSINSLRPSLGVNRIYTEGFTINDDKVAILEDVFRNVEFSARHDLIVVEIAFNVLLEGSESCFVRYGCAADGVAPVAQFTYLPESITQGDLVSFTDESTGDPTVWQWSYTDPNDNTVAFSTEQNPSLVLNIAGSWTIQLTVTNAFGSSSTSTVISVASAAPVADFTADNLSVELGETVEFTDASTGAITSWSWNFGAGATPATANTQGPHLVTYSTTGQKTVSLQVTGPGGSDTETKTNYITVVNSPEIVEWLARISGNGGTISQTAIDAHQVFYSAVSSVRSNIIRLNTFAGNNLNAALCPIFIGLNNGTPIGNSIDINSNFVSGDFAQATGLGSSPNVNKTLNTGVSPSASPDLGLNSAAYGFFAATNVAEFMVDIGGGDGVTNEFSILETRSGGGNILGSCNSTDFTQSPIADARGLTIIIRRNDSQQVINKNGIDGTPDASASTSETTETIKVFGAAGTFSTKKSFGYLIARSLTQAEATIIYNAWVALNTALSR